MNIRNGTYTLVKGLTLEIYTVRDQDEKVSLRYEGISAPCSNFRKSDDEENVFYLGVTISELSNAYGVKTYGEIEGKKVQVFKGQTGFPNTIKIASRDQNVAHQLKMVEVNTQWFMKEITINQLDKLWEERSPSEFGLPLPEIKRIEYICIN